MAMLMSSQYSLPSSRAVSTHSPSSTLAARALRFQVVHDLDSGVTPDPTTQYLSDPRTNDTTSFHDKPTRRIS